MRLRRLRTTLGAHLTLTRRVALLSLAPIVALGFILTHVLQSQVVARTLADASESAQLIAHIGVQPRLTERDLRDGLSPAQVRELDHQLSGAIVTRNLARIKIWNAHHEAIYSDDHSLIGHVYPPSDELQAALAGHPPAARLITPRPHEEEASEVGLGELVEVYVPLRFGASSRPAGAFEIYLSYRPIASAVSRDQRTIVLLVAGGLALLWAIIYRIVAGASRRLGRQAEENYRLARYDPLTWLPNRMRFIEEVADAAARDDDARGALAVLVIDLDRFKQTNNTLGDATGDQVLREVARRLRAGLGPATLVARFGGDEYAILCPRAEGVAGALETARAVQARLEPPIELDGVALNVEASIGIAVMGEHADSVDALLQRADAALARAKAGGTRVEVYSPERDSFDAGTLALLGEVRAALEHSEFVLHYQPQVDLKTRRIIGAEALLRWEHPERGMLAPVSFIPLIEHTALIGPLTMYVIERALAQMGVWRRLGLRLAVSVNLSARNLLDPELPQQIAQRLRDSGIPPAQLIVEVTESAAMADPERAIGVLLALRANGVGVSIDDFGTGNASIQYLATLPANEIKIDKSFIDGILEDPRAEAIVRSTVDLARHLGMDVVAEGIETEAVAEHLEALGCDTAQGYFFSRPLPQEELTPVLKGAFGIPSGTATAIPRAGALVRYGS